MTIILTPVLELEPYTFKNPDREYPLSYSTEINEQFWRDCLIDSGITDLEPYQPGSWFVPLANIHNLIYLKTIINKKFEDNSRESIAEMDFSSLSGGCVFEYRDIIIFPNCCCDLGDIAEWEAATHCKNKEKETLWIGHPWLKYRSKEDLIEITQTAESGEPPQPEIFDIPRKELTIAVEQAKEEMTEFALKIIPIAREILPNNYNELIARLVWGNCNYQEKSDRH